MRRLLFAITVLLTSCRSDKKEQTFSLREMAPIVLESKGYEVYHYWEFENKPLFWEINLGPVLELKSYRDSLEIELGKDFFPLAVQKEASQNNVLDTVNLQNGDLINARLVHSGIVGTIRPINFLEAELLNYQLMRYPLLSHPTEFHGFILLHDSLRHVKVYFAASDQPWPPKPTVILESIKRDLKQGWNLTYHLHNHYEPKSNEYIGILAPSLADAQFFTFLSEEFGLDKALITNGFHTVQIESEDFPKFKAHPNY